MNRINVVSQLNVIVYRVKNGTADNDDALELEEIAYQIRQSGK